MSVSCVPVRLYVSGFVSVCLRLCKPTCRFSVCLSFLVGLALCLRGCVYVCLRVGFGVARRLCVSGYVPVCLCVRTSRCRFSVFLCVCAFLTMCLCSLCV